MPATPVHLPRLGVDLLSDEVRLPEGAVRAATNVDIDRDGQFGRRAGWVPALPGEWSALHAWQDALLAQRGRTLLRIDPQTLSEEVVCDLRSESPADFTEYNGSLYVCSRAGLWALRPDEAQAYPAGVRLPPTLPDLHPADSGALAAGRYMVAISVVDERGEESPAAVLGAVRTQAGLLLTGLPVLHGMRWRVYLSPPDGDVLYLAEEFAAVWSQYALSAYPDGAPCETVHRASMPGGRFVRGWAGRLYVARDDTLWYSDALRPHITAPQHNFVPFVGAIRFVEFVSGGAYVGDDRGVWWLAGGDPTAWRAELVSRARAVPRSSLLVPGYEVGAVEGASPRECALWLSADGHMVGLPDGAVIALNSDRVRLDPETAGRSVFLQRDGVAQVITLTASPGPAHVFGVATDTKGTQR